MWIEKSGSSLSICSFLFISCSLSSRLFAVSFVCAPLGFMLPPLRISCSFVPYAFLPVSVFISPHEEEARERHRFDCSSFAFLISVVHSRSLMLTFFAWSDFLTSFLLLQMTTRDDMQDEETPTLVYQPTVASPSPLLWSATAEVCNGLCFISSPPHPPTCDVIAAFALR